MRGTPKAQGPIPPLPLTCFAFLLSNVFPRKIKLALAQACIRRPTLRRWLSTCRFVTPVTFENPETKGHFHENDDNLCKLSRDTTSVR